MSPHRRQFNTMLGLALTAPLGACTPARDDRPGLSYAIRLTAGGPIVIGSPAPPRAENAWTTGYTQAELDDAQAKYDLVFPPDLVALFRERRPVMGYDWRTDDKDIRAMLAWPLEGLLFDVENNALWWPEWGDRPATAEARQAVLTAVVRKAPKLVPLISHRYIPTEPHETGNPVFSIYQADVIYYGADLADYFERELVDPHRPFPAHIKPIRFWSELVEREGGSERHA